jgi:FkbM family methyltransferase
MVSRIISYLPDRWQQGLRKWKYRRQMVRGQFRSPEPEYQILDTFVEEGEWVIDIGANVGQYTARLSSLVGAKGRVFAFEPIPETFEALAANTLLLPHRNVTLLNLAVSDRSGIVGLEIPEGSTGLRNYYGARIASDEPSVFVYSSKLDSFDFESRISLVKVDAEGHELPILMGMASLLERDHPTLIVEARRDAVDYLMRFGYVMDHLPQSPNYLFK